MRQLTLVGNPKPMGCLMDGGSTPDGQRSLQRGRNLPWVPEISEKSFLGMNEIKPPTPDFLNSSQSLRNPSNKYSWMGLWPTWNQVLLFF